MKRRWWVIIGLLIGLAGGLSYAWLIDPVQYVDSYPPQMAPPYRRDWIHMTAFAYGHQANLRRAKIRLMHLPDTEVRKELGRALDVAVAEGQSSPVLQRMAGLAQHFGVDSPTVRIYTGAGESVEIPTVNPTSIASEPTPTPATLDPPTPSPVPPTMTPTPVFTPTYVISNVFRTCAPRPRIALSVTHEVSATIRGREERVTRGISNVETWLLWSDGADRAITGLRPRQGSGYVDFDVEPGLRYNLYLEEPTGVPLTVLEIQMCDARGSDGWTDWLIIVRPHQTRTGVTTSTITSTRSTKE